MELPTTVPNMSVLGTSLPTQQEETEGKVGHRYTVMLSHENLQCVCERVQVTSLL